MLKIKIWIAILVLYGTLVYQGSAWASEDGLGLVDLTPPLLTMISPKEGHEITAGLLLIEVEVTDGQSGVSQDSIILSLNGFDITANATIERMDQRELGPAKAWRVRFQTRDTLPSGEHLLQVEAVDAAGNGSLQQVRFSVPSFDSGFDWDVNLNSTTSYDFLPLKRLKNASNFNSHLQLSEQRFTLQLQSSTTDHPSLVTDPNLGSYYFHLERYALGWRTKWFALQYGDLNLPFRSGLLRFGSSFKGSYLTSRGLSKGELSVFQGTLASSFGFGISAVGTLGGVYRWQRGAVKNQLFLVQLGSTQTKILGFQDERPFSHGILRTEVAYGLGEQSGGALRLQGATTLLGVNWNSDMILIQRSYPLPHLSPLSSAQGGAFQFSLGGSKELSSCIQLNGSYSQLVDNLQRTLDHINRRHSMQVGLSGVLAERHSWQISYQSGKREGALITRNHSLDLGIRSQVHGTTWTGGFTLRGSSAQRGIQCEWNIACNKSLKDIKLKISPSLQYSLDTTGDNRLGSTLRMRLGAEKEWIEDGLKGSLTATYQSKKERDDLTRQRATSQSLSLEVALHYQATQNNLLKFSGSISRWENRKSSTNGGIDISLGISWQTKLF